MTGRESGINGDNGYSRLPSPDSPRPPISLPDPLAVVRASSLISSFTTNPDFPGQLVAWATSYCLWMYRSGMACLVPMRYPLVLPIGMGDPRSRLGKLWLRQELMKLGEAMVEDLLCVAVTGGTKLPVPGRGKRGSLITRDWKWRAVSQLHFVSPARVRVQEKAYAPARWKGAQCRPDVEIGLLVKVDMGRGVVIDAMVPKHRGRA